MRGCTGNLKWLAVGLTLATALLGAACSSDSKSGATTTTRPTTPTSSSATTTALPAEQEVIARYNEFWNVYASAGQTMNVDDPRLPQVAVGDELDTIRKTFLARKAGGEVFTGSMDLSPTVDHIDGDTATVRDCQQDNIQIVNAQTGVTTEPNDPARKLVIVTLARDSGAWKVAAIKLEDSGCTASS
jgi:hypothetical protein